MTAVLGLSPADPREVPYDSASMYSSLVSESPRPEWLMLSRRKSHFVQVGSVASKLSNLLGMFG